ncbi:MAG: hypothetical protein PHI39_11245, partial [Kiritimatiellae bacterium]|nr:hypothetical protein [Kiritimatiellia bacterium]MDD4118775.1 hypothetical protein [Kiritimatiellia bacterium]
MVFFIRRQGCHRPPEPGKPKTPLWIGKDRNSQTAKKAKKHSAAEPQPKKQGHEKHEKPQRGKAATKLIRTHELMKMERGISRKTGNAGKQDRLRAIPEM